MTDKINDDDISTAASPTPRGGRRPAYSMRALGRGELPHEFVLAGVTWRHVRTVKHDFFACTGFYQNDAGTRAVLKLSRTADFAGMPLEWIGRWLCSREMRFYKKLADVPNIPALLGTLGRTGFIHAYVHGRPLAKDKPVPDGFFRELFGLLDTLHQRDIAYVDTNKPENILLGDDGSPHLIDFQISWDLHRFPWSRLNRWLLRRLQAEDLYHIRKHHRRLRPDELPANAADQPEQLSRLIRLHRMIAKPYKRFRRQTMARLRESGRLLPEGSK